MRYEPKMEEQLVRGREGRKKRDAAGTRQPEDGADSTLDYTAGWR
jgi:hypothetical protein